MKIKKTLPALIGIIVFGILFTFLLSDKKGEIMRKEIALKAKMEALQCNDSCLVTSRDYSYLLKRDSIQLGETLFINKKYPGDDYIWRNSQGLYEVTLRNKEIKIKRFCDNELAEN